MINRSKNISFHFKKVKLTFTCSLTKKAYLLTTDCDPLKTIGFSSELSFCITDILQLYNFHLYTKTIPYKHSDEILLELNISKYSTISSFEGL